MPLDQVLIRLNYRSEQYAISSESSGLLGVHTLRLNGLTILVTRAAEQASPFRQLLQAQGATVLTMPALKMAEPSHWASLDQAIQTIDLFDWVIFTSVNGAHYFFKRANELGYDVSQSLSNVQVAAVGRKTANWLQAQQIEADFVPPNYVADSLIEHFPEQEDLAGKRVLYPCLEAGGREFIVEQLKELGAIVQAPPAYQSLCPEQIPSQVLEALRQRAVDVITFASPKTVRNTRQLLEQHQVELGVAPEQILATVQIASIGPQTSIACKEVFGRVDLEPEEYTLDGLTQALTQLCD